MNEDKAYLEMLLARAIEAESAGDTARSDEIFDVALEWEWWVVNPDSISNRFKAERIRLDYSPNPSSRVLPRRFGFF